MILESKLISNCDRHSEGEEEFMLIIKNQVCLLMSKTELGKDREENLNLRDLCV